MWIKISASKTGMWSAHMYVKGEFLAIIFLVTLTKTFQGRFGVLFHRQTWAGGIIGSYFEHYREVIFNFFGQNARACHEWHVVSTRRVTCHKARLTMALLWGEFRENVISRSGPVNFFCRGAMLKLMFILTSPLQLTEMLPKAYTKIGLSGRSIWFNNCMK